jgi:hypothetical protein
MGKSCWWKLDEGNIKIYTENIEKMNEYPPPSTIQYKRKSHKGNTVPAFAVEYIVKFGSEEQKQMFKDFGIKNRDKMRD